MYLTVLKLTGTALPVIVIHITVQQCTPLFCTAQHYTTLHYTALHGDLWQTPLNWVLMLLPLLHPKYALCTVLSVLFTGKFILCVQGCRKMECWEH